MSTKQQNCGRKRKYMSEFKVNDLLNELNISRSYLYKIINEENIIINKNDSGRYLWDEESIGKIRNIIDREEENADEISTLIANLGLKQSFINNRRYLGNKYSLSEFIRETVDKHCKSINIVADVFSGTGAVSNAFKDKMLITNDLLYSNYISNYAWFSSEEYDPRKIIKMIFEYNNITTNEENYMRANFADTFFSADDCSKIGVIREDIENQYLKKLINFKEYAILITSLLYGMDRIANTVGHYDAYRKNASFDKTLVLHVILPEKNLNNNNICFNEDANELVKRIECDLLYLDPPYNSRQYSDAYHLLENVARWEKTQVFGIARKMDRTAIKSDYCMSNAVQAFDDLIKAANAKYILLSYNNMKTKGNDRSNAKISDEDIIRILSKKGEVKVFSTDYKSFSTGKSNIHNNKERLFLCVVRNQKKNRTNVACPFNYIGGKFKILDQLQPLFPHTSVFFDVFAGGGNVGVNSTSSKVILNDKDSRMINLIEYVKNTPTDKLLSQVDMTIEKYKLSNSNLYGYAYYGCDSKKGLGPYNKDKFLKLRSDYNKSVRDKKENIVYLYVLMVYSFNNQIRFNKNNEFNLPVGKRDFNSKMRSKLILFSEELKKKDISFLRLDFRDINLANLSQNTFLYCDPPYLITGATYNENGLWSEKDENDLYAFLDKANSKGFKFALSNVLESKGKQNIILTEWIKKNNYQCNYLDKSYSNSNYHRKNKELRTVEVLVTNYDTEEAL